MELDNTPMQIKQAGELVAITREQAEVQAAFVIAQKIPRREAEVFVECLKAFDRPSLAEKAEYSFPRGGKTIKGPSVDLARECARLWGNLDFGHRVVTTDGDEVTIEGYCIDLQKNTRRAFQDKFKRKIQRKNKETGLTEWIEPDERDFRELCNRRGAIVMRNAILATLPSDLIEDCCLRADDTARAAVKGELKQSREEAIRRLVLAFDKLSVTAAMLVKRLKHPLEEINEEELVELRQIWKSIYDGNSRRADHFEFAGEPQAQSSTQVDIKERLAKAKPQEAVTTGPSPIIYPTPSEAAEPQPSLPLEAKPSAVVNRKKGKLSSEFDRIKERAKQEEEAIMKGGN